jgi:hypothetical protein
MLSLLPRHTVATCPPAGLTGHQDQAKSHCSTCYSDLVSAFRRQMLHWYTTPPGSSRIRAKSGRKTEALKTMHSMSRNPRLESIMPGPGNAARLHQRKLFLAFTLLAACAIAVNALPSMAGVKAKRIPTKTVLSYTASTGTNAIFTARVSPSGATGSVLFIQDPPPR